MIDLGFIRLDENLMYVLQQLTGDSATTIIEHFYFLAQQIAEDAYRTSKGWRIYKTANLFYKDTPIMYSLLVYSWGASCHLPDARKNGEVLRCIGRMQFKGKYKKYEKTAIYQVATEAALLHGNTWPDFDKPKTKTPRFLKGKV